MQTNMDHLKHLSTISSASFYVFLCANHGPQGMESKALRSRDPLEFQSHRRRRLKLIQGADRHYAKMLFQKYLYLKVGR
jgi:hypothetical protein